VAEGALRSVLAGTDLAGDIGTAIERVLSGFAALPLHSDVAEAIVALSGHGIRLVTLTNGSTAVAHRLLSEAGIRDRFEQLPSVEAAGVGSRPPAPTSTRPELAVCPPGGCCSSPSIPGTFMERHGPGYTPHG
jgi:2-haloacid dehalogenase